MRSLGLAALVACAACNGGGDEHQVIVTTRFDVTEVTGVGTSPLDPLANQTIDLELVFDDSNVLRSTAGSCKTLALAVPEAGRTALGATAEIVTREILDRLVGWDITFELCEGAVSTINLDAAINELSLIFGCNVPAAAKVRDANDDPVLTSFTASGCSASILDVVNDRTIGNRDFTIKFDTGPERVP